MWQWIRVHSTELRCLLLVSVCMHMMRCSVVRYGVGDERVRCGSVAAVAGGNNEWCGRVGSVELSDVISIVEYSLDSFFVLCICSFLALCVAAVLRFCLYLFISVAAYAAVQCSRIK